MLKSILIAAAALAMVSSTACAKSSSSSSRSSSSAKNSSYRSAAKPVAVKPRPVAPVRSVSTVRTTKPVVVKKRKEYAEIEYFAFNDCTRYVSASFNGYRCIDRD